MADQQNNDLQVPLQTIATKLEELKPKSKRNWLPLLAFLVSLLALGATIATYVTNLNIQHAIAKTQRETQAYTYWQSFLKLAVDNPELANGINRIGGKVFLILSRWTMKNAGRTRLPTNNMSSMPGLLRTP